MSFLLKSQNSNGWWSTSEQPAVTAMVLTAFNKEASGRYRTNRPSEVRQADDFLLGSAKPYRSIHRGTFINYNTSLALIALSMAEQPSFLPVVRAARAYLVRSQIDLGTEGKVDTVFDGGVRKQVPALGYEQHPDGHRGDAMVGEEMSVGDSIRGRGV